MNGFNQQRHFENLVADLTLRRIDPFERFLVLAYALAPDANIGDARRVDLRSSLTEPLAHEIAGRSSKPSCARY
jgi:hypothetical protein